MRRIEVSNLLDEELTLPRAARLPVALLPPELAQQAVTPTTVAPTAMDVEPPRHQRDRDIEHNARRPIELALVAAAGFALAWSIRGELMARSTTAAATPPAFAIALPAAASTLPLPICPVEKTAATSLAGSSIPTVNVADLPLLGSVGNSAAHSTTGRAAAHSAQRGAAGPGRAELVAALSQVARAASGCGERGGPVRVVVTFANSGVARSIRVSGEDLPGPTRSCIIGAASRARVTAFSGEPVSVGKTL
jgi:hypothetical protein